MASRKPGICCLHPSLPRVCQPSGRPLAPVLCVCLPRASTFHLREQERPLSRPRAEGQEHKCAHLRGHVHAPMITKRGQVFTRPRRVDRQKQCGQKSKTALQTQETIPKQKRSCWPTPPPRWSAQHVRAWLLPVPRVAPPSASDRVSVNLPAATRPAHSLRFSFRIAWGTWNPLFEAHF